MSVGLTAARLGFVLEANAGFLVAKSRSACVRAAGCGTPDPAEHYKSGSECLPRSENLIENVVLFNDGRHDMLLLDVVAPAGADADTYAYSLMYGRPASYGTRLCPSSAHDVRLRHQLLGQTQQHVGHRDVHRHEIRPALIKGAISMNLLKAKAAKLT